MDQTDEIVCRLCLNGTNNENSKTIEENTREILEFLVSKLKLNEGIGDVLCNTCHTKLFAAYNFKAICMETEDSIFPYLDSKLLDMKEIFFIKNGYGQVKNVSEDENVCRLCMQLLSCEFVPLRDVDINMIHEYIAEVNFRSTKDPVICEKCFKSLITHSSFLRTCLDTEDKVKFSNSDNLSIKTEEVDIKPERNSPISDPSTQMCQLNKKDNSTNNLLQKGDSKVHIYNCEKCAFQTNRKSSLTMHLVKHKGSSEVPMYKCEECSYQTKNKYILPMHRLKHRDSTEVQMFHCDECGFESKYWRCLKKHRLKHQNPSEMQMYKCEKCSFETKHKWNLTNHKLIHKDKSQVQMYKCNDCRFETKYKRYLKVHWLKHHEPSKVPRMCEVDMKMEAS